ncbi:MAG: hypothetical protein RL662_1952, partial [Bacteroidota bacterium]
MPAPRRRKQVRKQPKRSIVSFLKSERGHFLIGVCFVFIALYITIGMVSFFITGAADQSKVVNKSFWDLISQKQDIANWTGVGGAFAAESLINRYFGIFTFVVPAFLATIGILLM